MGGPKIVLQVMQNWIKMILRWIKNGPKWSPTHPHPWRQQKSPARGKKKEKKWLLLIFYDVYEKLQKIYLPGS